jgi:hypothetical protein
MCQEKNLENETLADTLTHELEMDSHGPSIVPLTPVSSNPGQG